jgi:hypothetical protein
VARERVCRRDPDCKRSASIALPRRCHSVPPKCTAAGENLLPACISAEYGGTRVPIEPAHNPEVAGSNPAPATKKGPGNRAFLVLGPRDLPLRDPSATSARTCTHSNALRTSTRLARPHRRASPEGEADAISDPASGALFVSRSRCSIGRSASVRAPRLPAPEANRQSGCPLALVSERSGARHHADKHRWSQPAAWPSARLPAIATCPILRSIPSKIRW